ncbi:MAG: hypothetical protein KBH07_07560 [Flavobacteriales bacterium]|nr:hypothetical protein [Flavobacteriales bacterium]MBP9080291.1 hypothetical protein [Flavobacteriales bacterium]
MKKLILTTIILTLITIQGYGQKQCDIKTHYEDFILVQKSIYNEQAYLTKRVVETQKKSCFSDLVNNNPMFINYLLINFSSNANYQNLLDLPDSIAIRHKYFNDLKEDSLFNSVMTDLVNETIDKTTPKDTISMDKLLNVAVKYFSIMRLTDEGHYVGKVCVGLNDIKKTENERKPFIEAFSFSSILKHYQSEDYSMYDEFVKAIKELYKVNLGIDKDEKLLRAQGAMFLLMRNNENLRKMLKSEYGKQKDYLPFILTDN